MPLHRDQPLALPEGEVHVWLATLDNATSHQRDWGALLSADERERAAGFHFNIHRTRFVTARGILRVLIGRYLGKAPEAVVFTYGANGKPLLPGDALHFNVSHSEDRGLFAFSATTPVGADIEAVRPLPDALHIAGNYFSGPEAKELQALSPALQAQAFFRCWTRKEAFIKALGEGLSYPLDRFTVSLDEPARLLHVDGKPDATSQWTLHHLGCESGYLAAIATRQAEPQFRLYRYTDGGSAPTAVAS